MCACVCFMFAYFSAGLKARMCVCVCVCVHGRVGVLRFSLLRDWTKKLRDESAPLKIPMSFFFPAS